MLRMAATLFLLSLMGASAPAATLSEKDFHKAQNVAGRLERDKDLVNQTEKRQRQILANLFEINQRIKKISKENSNLESEKELLTASVEDLQDQIVELQGALQEKGRDLINHVRLIQQSKGFGWLNLLSGSQGPAEADLNLYIFMRLTQREKRNIQDYFTQKIQLQKNEKKLQTRLARLDFVMKDLAVRQRDFLMEQTTRKLALNEVKSQKIRVIQRMRTLRNTELVQKLEDTGLLDGLMRASFLEDKGNLNSPAPGELKQRFGIVKSPQSTYYKNHKGIFIQTKVHQEIKAIFEGKVAFVGEVGGFGRTLILDHGDHYYTVYSALSAVDVHEGQLVNRSAVLGQSGSTQFYSNSGSNSGIYFEVRHFSEPQNPMEWLKKGSL
jgi:septal ring factor EnvC (AmiA/AmiB activator)